jgi:hypothetical protein
MVYLILTVNQVTLRENTNNAKKRWKFTRSGPQPAVAVDGPSHPTYSQPTYPMSTVTPGMTPIPTANASQGNNGNTGSNRPLFDSESLEINHSTLTNVGRDQYHVINNYYVDPNLILGAYDYRRVDSLSMADVFLKFFPFSSGLEHQGNGRQPIHWRDFLPPHLKHSQFDTPAESAEDSQ